MYSTTGCVCSSAVTVRGSVPLARFSSAGIFPVSSTRSLFGPGVRIRLLRSLMVGFASCTSGRSAARNFARFFVAGFDSATSGSRSSSVARRFTNVVLALRSDVGSRPSARPRATFSSPIAAAVWSAFPTSEARSPRRAAMALTVRDVSVTKRWKVTWSVTISRTSADDVESVGLKYLAARLA